MADLDMFEEFGTDPFDAPIPGESLTADPSNPKPWEQPPEFTDVNEALKELFLLMTDDDYYIELLELIRNDMPLDMLTQTILFQGYMLGKWNTDLMLLLIEPTLYLLIGLAEHNRIFDYVVYTEEKDDLEEYELKEMIDDDIARMKRKPRPDANKNIENVLPESLLSQVRSAPMAAEMGEE